MSNISNLHTTDRCTGDITAGDTSLLLFSNATKNYLYM